MARMAGSFGRVLFLPTSPHPPSSQRSTMAETLRLTSPDTGVLDDLPKWSPDGSKIIFERDFPNNGVIDEISWDGTALHEIGSCVMGECIANGNPAYSPNGKKITFQKVLGADGIPTSIGIWVMNADGTNPRPLTQPTKTSADFEPSWSPDGKQIAFTRGTGSAQALFLIHPDGSGLHRLTRWAINAGKPRWRPWNDPFLAKRTECSPFLRSARRNAGTLASPQCQSIRP